MLSGSWLKGVMLINITAWPSHFPKLTHQYGCKPWFIGLHSQPDKALQNEQTFRLSAMWYVCSCMNKIKRDVKVFQSFRGGIIPATHYCFFSASRWRKISSSIGSKTSWQWLTSRPIKPTIFKTKRCHILLCKVTDLEHVITWVRSFYCWSGKQKGAISTAKCCPPNTVIHQSCVSEKKKKKNLGELFISNSPFKSRCQIWPWLQQHNEK